MTTIAEDETTAAPAATTLGIERWVQTAFIAGAVVSFLLLAQVVRIVWDLFAEPDPRFIVPIAGVLAGALSIGLYRAPKVHQYSHEVAVELSKVTWPSRQETWKQSVVVIVLSIISAVILGIFDAAWLAITNLLYQF